MKYILTIDTEKKEVSVNLDRPIILRTGAESLVEIEQRRRILREYENTNFPDWLYDEVLTIEGKLSGENERDKTVQ